MRFSSGTRNEETAKLAMLVDEQVHRLLPDHVVGSLLNFGLPVTGINQAYSTSGTIGSQDCDLSASLDSERFAGRQLPQNTAGRAGGAIPECAIQLPGRRHDGPDLELRPAVADRYPDQRA
jgi:hypothetical protein